MDYMKIYNSWLENNYIDEKTKEELLLIKDDESEIRERFYKNLEFGTGGLRGLMGAGTNRVNAYTIRKSAYGFARYILEKDFLEKCPKEMGVVIAYDSRNNSYSFSKEVALVLVSQGIKTYIFEGMRSVPELSFAIRHLGCVAGIAITASHNPKEYNGFKVYSEDGAQILPEEDKKISKYSKDIFDFSNLDVSLLNVLPKEQDEEYVNAVLETMINPDALKEISITYTPLYGTGFWPVREILYRAGFDKLNIVLEEAEENGNFPNLDSPNPEDFNVFKVAIKQAKAVNSDIIIATDPDSDRLGVMVRDKNGNYTHLNGNSIGVLMLEYIITQKKEKGILPENSFVVSTLVSTDMAKKIAETNGVRHEVVLTGFKNIAEKIKENESEFVFGFEESYGYLHGRHVRDKDAISSALLICEMVAFYKELGLTLLGQLDLLYKKYGYYKEETKSITFKGFEGSEKIKSIMQNFKQSLDLQSDVLYYNIGDGFVCIRPSGTEPKLKIYFGTKGDSLEDASNKLDAMIEEVMSKINKWR